MIGCTDGACGLACVGEGVGPESIGNMEPIGVGAD